MGVGAEGAQRRTIETWLGLAAAVMLCIGLVASPVVVDAQDGTGGDPAALVLAAFDSLSEGYRFTYSNSTVQTITQPDDLETVVYALYESTGDVDAAGGYWLEATNTGSEQPNGGGESMSYDFRRVAVDGVEYVYLSDGALDVWPTFMPSDWEAGWRRLDDMTASDTLLTPALINSILPAVWPTRVVPRASWVVDAVEQDPETIDGVATRVFDVTLDGEQVAIASAVESGMVDLNNLPAQSRLMAVSTFEVEMRAWVGADDGQLYRIVSDSLVFYPYRLLAEDDSTFPSYDLKMVSTAIYDVRDHGLVEPVAAPDLVAGS